MWSVYESLLLLPMPPVVYSIIIPMGQKGQIRNLRDGNIMCHYVYVITPCLNVDFVLIIFY